MSEYDPSPDGYEEPDAPSSQTQHQYPRGRRDSQRDKGDRKLRRGLIPLAILLPLALAVGSLALYQPQKGGHKDGWVPDGYSVAVPGSDNRGDPDGSPGNSKAADPSKSESADPESASPSSRRRTPVTSEPTSDNGGGDPDPGPDPSNDPTTDPGPTSSRVPVPPPNPEPSEEPTDDPTRYPDPTKDPDPKPTTPTPTPTTDDGLGIPLPSLPLPIPLPTEIRLPLYASDNQDGILGPIGIGLLG